MDSAFVFLSTILYPLYSEYMSDAQATTQASGSGLTVPAEIQAKFGELVELIKGSESMNDEERQYWINLLPVMTPEQISNLNDILNNEKTQLAAIDEKYGKEIDQASTGQSIESMEAERRKKKAERAAAEAADRGESHSADDLLKQIEG